MLDFTQNKYAVLFEAIKNSSYKAVTVAELVEMEETELHSNLIILRHDVDRFPQFALELAKIEAKNDLRSSYYFRIPSSWDEEIIKKIAKMGHEVSLHYECLDKAKGNIQEAGRILGEEIKMMRKIADCKTVAMHGNPITRHDNRDIWKEFKLEEFDLNGEVYLSIDFEKVMYYSDTGRTWQEGKFNIKDIIPDSMKAVKNKPIISTTDELIQLINTEDRNIYLLTHPSRWRGSYGGWTFSYITDSLLNYTKVLYKFIRSVLE